MAKKIKQAPKAKQHTFKANFSAFEGWLQSSLVIDKYFNISLKDSAGNAVLPISRSYEVTYPRQNKDPKIVNSIFVKGHESKAEFGNSYLKNFDEIYVIDTNPSKKTIDGNSLSVSAVIGGYVLDRKVEAIDGKFSAYPLTWIQIWNPIVLVNPERIGWVEAIKAIVRGQDQFRGIQGVQTKKVAIIVDSDYDSLDAFNNRTQPILGSHYLPENFTLIFATDGAGKEQFVANYLMQRADTMSKELIEKVNELPPGFDKLRVDYGWCSHIGFLDARNRYEFS